MGIALIRDLLSLHRHPGKGVALIRDLLSLHRHPGKGVALIRDLPINAPMIINQSLSEIPAYAGMTIKALVIPERAQHLSGISINIHRPFKALFKLARLFGRSRIVALQFPG
jgi:hypothetical protein